MYSHAIYFFFSIWNPGKRLFQMHYYWYVCDPILACFTCPLQFMSFPGLLCVVTEVCSPNSIYLSGDVEGAYECLMLSSLSFTLSSNDWVNCRRELNEWRRALSFLEISLINFGTDVCLKITTTTTTKKTLGLIWNRFLPYEGQV